MLKWRNSDQKILSVMIMQKNMAKCLQNDVRLKGKKQRFKPSNGQNKMIKDHKQKKKKPTHMTNKHKKMSNLLVIKSSSSP